MTPPETAASRFLLCCLLGAVLGTVYGFLRPIRRKSTALGDCLFLAAAGWLWLEMGFRVCRGDLRMGYLIGFGAGCILWEITAGRLLQPVFFTFC